MNLDSVDYAKGETPMTDYQFKQYEALRDKCDVLERKNEALYQLIKTYVETGKSPKEFLAAVEALQKS